jgi:Flp pilus assembly protein TadG
MAVSARRSFWRDGRGAAAVEFAIVSPVLILIMIGMLVYGVYFGAAHSVQQIAADAARASVAGLNDEEREAIALSHVSASAGSYVFLSADRLVATAGPSPDDANLFVVSVAYDASDLPIFGFAGLVPVPRSTIAHSAVIRRGGY